MSGFLKTTARALSKFLHEILNISQSIKKRTLKTIVYAKLKSGVTINTVPITTLNVNSLTPHFSGPVFCTLKANWKHIRRNTFMGTHSETHSQKHIRISNFITAQNQKERASKVLFL